MGSGSEKEKRGRLSADFDHAGSYQKRVAWTPEVRGKNHPM